MLTRLSALTAATIFPLAATAASAEPPPIPPHAPVTGAVLPEVQQWHTIEVGPDAEHASIAAGVEAAVAQLRQGQPTRVSIAAGIYREGAIQIDGEDDEQLRETPLMIEAAGDEPVIVRGSEVFTDWRVEDDGALAHHWPYNMHLWRQWRDRGPEHEIGWRREMVFVDGEMLTQVLTRDEMTPGTYYVDEQDIHEPEGTLWVKLPEGVAREAVEIEVSVGPEHTRVSREKNERFGDYIPPWPPRNALGIRHKDNVHVRGLSFEHANNRLGFASVTVNNARNVKFEDCGFRWNNGLALSVTHSEGITLRNCQAVHNGGSGMSAHHVTNSVWEDNVTSHNNWRGDMAQYWRFGVAGIKVHYMNGMHVRRHTAQYNLADGFWLDLQNKGIVMEDSLITDNLRCGIFHEVSWGDALFRNNHIARNPWGLVIKGTPGGVAIGNTFEDNFAQVQVIIERREFRGSPHIGPLEKWNRFPVNWVFHDNTFIGSTMRDGGGFEAHRTRDHPPGFRANLDTSAVHRVLNFGIDREGREAFLATVVWGENHYEYDGVDESFYIGRDRTLSEFREYLAELRTAMAEAGEAPAPAARPTAAAGGQATELRLDISQNELVWNWEQGQGLGDWTRQTRSLELKTEEGTRFARIEDGQFYVRVALGAEVDRVRYATRMRASDVEPTERQYRLPLLRLYFRDAEGERVGPRWEWLHLPGDAPWTDLENELDVPDGAVEIELRAGKTHTPAVVDYDHITLEATRIRGMEQDNP